MTRIYNNGISSPIDNLETKPAGRKRAAKGDVTPSVGRKVAAFAVGALMLGAKAVGAEMAPPARRLPAPAMGGRKLLQQPCTQGTTASCIPCPTNPTPSNDPCNQLAVHTQGVDTLPIASTAPIMQAADRCVAIGTPDASGVFPQPFGCPIGVQNAVTTLVAHDNLGLKMTNPAGWLETQGNRFVLNGDNWRGHGANVFDTTLNGAVCTAAPERAGSTQAFANAEAVLRAEVNRRTDALVASGATYMRVLLDARPRDVNGTLVGGDSEKFTQAIYDTPSASRILSDSAYYASIVDIVDHATTYPNLFVDLSLFADPSASRGVDPAGTPMKLCTTAVPSAGTNAIWSKLATTFAHYPRVIFGLANEPGTNGNVTRLNEITDAINSNIDAIRQAETAAGAPGQHIIKVPALTVSGLPYGRDLSWWGAHPLSRANVAYSIHPYESDFTTINTEIMPYRQLPIIVDEFAPNMQPNMFLTQAMHVAAVLEGMDPPIPYAAWIYAPTSAGGLLSVPTSSSDDCYINATTISSPWGTPYLSWLRGVAQGLGN